MGDIPDGRGGRPSYLVRTSPRGGVTRRHDQEIPMAALQEVIGELATDPSARAALEDDPDGFLVARGLDGFTAEDLRDALDLAADGLPVHVAAHLTGPDVPPADAGEEDHEGVLRLLGHAAKTPEAPVEEAEGLEDGLDGDTKEMEVDADDDADLDFGAGHAGDEDDDAVASDEPAPDEGEDDADQRGEDTDDLDGMAKELDELDGDLVPQLEEEQPDLGEPEPLGEESEEAPGHWG
ncbi:hypothetical protein B7486_56325, partial [cyanobacterium TDX16]